MSQCQMCGREIPDGQQLCPTCRNAWEWRQRQQAQEMCIRDSLRRHLQKTQNSLQKGKHEGVEHQGRHPDGGKGQGHSLPQFV